MILSETYKLYNGVEIPKIGFGTWQTKSGKEAYDATTYALQAGYRHIDTAYTYENEQSVGQAILDSKIKREEIFITTKLPADIKTYEGALEYFEKSIKNLGVDYIDLYLIHAPWPWSNVGADYTSGNIEAWKALIKLYNDKRVRSIGVSNFHVKDIEALIQATGFKPMVNQIRYFVGNTQEPITKYCQENDILIEAYSPLATGELLNNELLNKLAKKYNKTIAQICLRYCLEKSTLPLPKSVNKDRIYANTDVDFEISKEDMQYLDNLHHIASTRPFRD